MCVFIQPQRSIAEVEWNETGKCNVYRVGHKGKVSLFLYVTVYAKTDHMSTKDTGIHSKFWHILANLFVSHQRVL